MSARYLMLDPQHEPYDLGVDELMRSKVQFNINAMKDQSTGGTGFAEELVKILEDAAVGTFGVDIFVGTNASIPKGNGPYLSIIETSGIPPIRIQNQAAPAYLHPTALIVARASDYVVARDMARAAYDALTVVVNQTITP